MVGVEYFISDNRLKIYVDGVFILCKKCSMQIFF